MIFLQMLPIENACKNSRFGSFSAPKPLCDRSPSGKYSELIHKVCCFYQANSSFYRVYKAVESDKIKTIKVLLILSELLVKQRSRVTANSRSLYLKEYYQNITERYQIKVREKDSIGIELHQTL